MSPRKPSSPMPEAITAPKPRARKGLASKRTRPPANTVSAQPDDDLSVIGVPGVQEDTTPEVVPSDDVNAGAPIWVTANGSAIAPDIAALMSAGFARMRAEAASPTVSNDIRPEPRSAAQLPSGATVAAAPYVLPRADLSAPIITPSPNPLTARYDFLRLNDLASDGGTFTIEAVTAPYAKPQGDRSNIRAVCIRLTDGDGQSFVRWIACGTGSAARDAFLARCQEHCERGACPGLYVLTASATDERAKDITPRDVPSASRIAPEAAPVVAPPPIDVSDALAVYDTPEYPLCILTADTAEPIVFAHGGVSDDGGPARPVVILHRVVGSGRTERVQCSVFLSAQIIISAIRHKSTSANDPSTLYVFSIVDGDGISRLHEKTHAQLFGRDKQLADLLAHNGLPDDSTNTLNMLSRYFRLLAYRHGREIKPSVESDVMGWNVVGTGDTRSLRFLTYNAVETASGIVTHAEAAFFPSSRFASHPVAAQFTSPSRDAMSLNDTASKLNAFRDIINLRSDIDHVNAAVLGHAVYTIAPYRPDETVPGRVKFYLEVFGVRGCGKSSQVSAFDPLFGAGFDDPIAAGVHCNMGAGRSTAVFLTSVSTWFPFARIQTVDFKQGGNEKQMTARAEMIARTADGSADGVGTRNGGAKGRGDTTGSVVGTIEIDEQAREASQVLTISGAQRYFAVEMPKPSADMRDSSHMARIHSRGQRAAVACLGADLRRWFMSKDHASFDRLGLDIHDNAVRAEHSIRGIADDSDRFSVHLRMMVTGCLWFRHFLSDVYGDDAFDIIEWIDCAVIQLVEYARYRVVHLFNDMPSAHVETSRHVVRNALLRMFREDGHVHLGKEDHKAVDAHMVGHGHHLGDLGHRLKSGSGNAKWEPSGPEVLAHWGHHDGAPCIIIPTSVFTAGSTIVRAVNIAWKAHDQSRVLSPDDVLDAVYGMAVPHEGKGHRRERIAGGRRVRCIIIRLDVLFGTEGEEMPSTTEQMQDADTSNVVVMNPALAPPAINDASGM